MKNFKKRKKIFIILLQSLNDRVSILLFGRKGQNVYSYLKKDLVDINKAVKMVS